MRNLEVSQKTTKAAKAQRRDPHNTFSNSKTLRTMAPQSTFRRLLLIATVTLAAMLVVEATQVMHRPTGYKDTARTFKVDKNAKTNVIQKRAGNKVSFAYFTNWGIYGANFRKRKLLLSDVSDRSLFIEPTDIVASPITRTFRSTRAPSFMSFNRCAVQIFFIPSRMSAPTLVLSNSPTRMLMKRCAQFFQPNTSCFNYLAYRNTSPLILGVTLATTSMDASSNCIY